MQKTRKMLKTLIKNCYKEKSNEDLCKEYKKDLNPVYVAVMFDRMFKLTNNQRRKYYLIQGDDFASISLESIEYCMRTKNTNNKTKFIVYYFVVLSNKLKSELTKLNTIKRSINNNCLSLGDWDNYYDENFDSIDFMLPNNLNQKENVLCKLLSEGYTFSECAKIMKVTREGLYHTRKRIKEKLLNDCK